MFASGRDELPELQPSQAALRLRRLQQLCGAVGVDALLLVPGTDGERAQACAPAVCCWGGRVFSGVAGRWSEPTLSIHAEAIWIGCKSYRWWTRTGQPRRGRKSDCHGVDARRPGVGHKLLDTNGDASLWGALAAGHARQDARVRVPGRDDGGLRSP